MIKREIRQEDIAIANIYAPNIGAPKYTKQTLTEPKEEINSDIIIVGDFDSPVSTMDTSSRQRISKETTDLNSIIDQMDLTDIYRAFSPTPKED